MIEENKDLLKFNAEGIQPADMFLNARNKAVEAVDAFVKKHGEPMYCGFANVSIHPAKGRFVNILKKAGIGSKGFRGGYRISYYDIMPKDHPLNFHSHLQLAKLQPITAVTYTHLTLPTILRV